MDGQLWAWTVLLLLTSRAAWSANAAESLSIVLMDWTFMNATTLTVCTHTDLLSSNMTLVTSVSGQGLTDYPGSRSSENSSCAHFSDDELQLPEVTTIYELLVTDPDSGEVQQSGSVSFAFTMAQTLINCSGSKFLRISISNGTFLNDICLPSNDSTSLLCYTATETPTVCVNNLDKDIPDFQVCVTPDNAEDLITPGTLNAVSLNYETGSLTIAEEPGTPKELLYRYERGNTSVALCSSDVCPVANFKPSTNSYELCGVYLNETGVVTDVNTASFQDLYLTVVDTEPLLDFTFMNLYEEQKYEVYTGDDPETILGNGPTILDCTGIPVNSSCYGFVLTESLPTYLAVSYVNHTNAVISKVE